MNLLLALALITSAEAAKPACLAGPGLDAIASSFELKLEGPAPVPSETLCDPSSLPAKTLQALLELKQLPKLESAGPDFERDFMKGAPYSFFQKRVAQISFDLTGESTGCKQLGTLAYVSGKDSKTMHLCPLSANLTKLGLQSNLLHEARHLKDPDQATPQDELAAYPHVLCESGQAKGYDACDKEYDSGGSYSLQTEFFLQVAHTRALPRAVREEARGTALAYVLDHFNRLPFPLEEGILLQADDGDVSFFSAGTHKLTPLIKNVPTRNIVSMRGVPVVLDPQAGTVQNYAGPNTFLATPGSFAKFYREQNAEERAKILDVYFGGSQACLLYASSLYCELGNASGEIRFPADFRPLQLTVISLYRDDIVFVVSAEGDFYMLPLKTEVAEWSFAKLEKNTTLTRFLSVGMLANQKNFGLDLEGKLIEFKTVDQRAPVAGLEGRKFRKILGAFRWSPRLNDL